jgi:putative transposase
MIDKEHPLPITKQCQILQLSRSGVYYMPVLLSDKDRELMRLIDEIHLEEPYLGSRGMKSALRIRGHKAGRIHVRTLMRKMGIEAIYKKPRLSKPHPEHTVYPYLLRGLDITKANAVWCADITYIPMAKGFCYLVAVMDWASRKVLIRSTPHSARKLLKKHYGTTEHPTYSIPIKAVSLLQMVLSRY